MLEKYIEIFLITITSFLILAILVMLGFFDVEI